MPGLPQPLVAQILPYVQNEGERRTWLTAQLNQDPVYQRITWVGSVQSFPSMSSRRFRMTNWSPRFAAYLRARS